MKIETVKDLKKYLQEKIDLLEELDENAKVEVVQNTYWLDNRYEYLATQEGFISL